MNLREGIQLLAVILHSKCLWARNSNIHAPLSFSSTLPVSQPVFYAVLQHIDITCSNIRIVSRSQLPVRSMLVLWMEVLFCFIVVPVMHARLSVPTTLGINPWRECVRALVDKMRVHSGYLFSFRLPRLRYFRVFSSVVRQMPGYTSQTRGTVRTLPN